MSKTNKKELGRIRRHRRVRKKVFGTKDRPRLSVHRSLKNIYLQLIDDISQKTLFSASSLDKEIREQMDSENRGNIKGAFLTGQLLGKRAREKGINQVVFDKGGYKYHGRVKAVAEAVRKEGIKF